MFPLLCSQYRVPIPVFLFLCSQYHVPSTMFWLPCSHSCDSGPMFPSPLSHYCPPGAVIPVPFSQNCCHVSLPCCWYYTSIFQMPCHSCAHLVFPYFDLRFRLSVFLFSVFFFFSFLLPCCFWCCCCYGFLVPGPFMCCVRFHCWGMGRVWLYVLLDVNKIK